MTLLIAPLVVISAVVGSFYLKKKQYLLLYLYVFALIFEGFLTISQGILTLNKAIVILLGVLYILSLKDNNFKLDLPRASSFRILLFFKIIQLPLLFLNLANIEAAMLNLVSDLQIPVFIVLFYNIINTNKQFTLSLKYFVYSVVIAAFWISFQNDSSFFDKETGRLEFMTNENDLAFIISLSLFSIFYLFKRVHKLEKLIFLFSIPFVIYILLMTGSRGTIIAVVCTIVTATFLDKKPILEKVYSFFYIFIVGAALYSLWVFEFFPEVNLMIDKRMQDTYNEGVSGRDVIWWSYFTDFINRPYGMGLGYTFRLNIYGNHGAHNDFIKLLVEYGVIGVSFYLIFFFNLLKEVLKYFQLNSNSKYALQLVLFIIFAGLTNDTLLFKAFGLGLALIYTLIKLPVEHEGKDITVYRVFR